MLPTADVDVTTDVDVTMDAATTIAAVVSLAEMTIAVTLSGFSFCCQSAATDVADAADVVDGEMTVVC